GRGSRSTIPAAIFTSTARASFPVRSSTPASPSGAAPTGPTARPSAEPPATTASSPSATSRPRRSQSSSPRSDGTGPARNPSTSRSPHGRPQPHRLNTQPQAPPGGSRRSNPTRPSRRREEPSSRAPHPPRAGPGVDETSGDYERSLTSPQAASGGL